MNKGSCDVVRDLIPLVLDHAASEGTVDLVQKHIVRCQECRDIMTAMGENILPNTEGTEDFVAFCRRAGRNRRRLRVGMMLMVITLVILMGVGGTYVSDRKANASVEIRPVSCQVMVDEKENVILQTELPEGREHTGCSIRGENGICYYVPHVFRWSGWFADAQTEAIDWGNNLLYMKDGVLMMSEMGEEEKAEVIVQEIRAGFPDDYEVIYRAGDEIPVVKDLTEQSLQRGVPDEYTVTSQTGDKIPGAVVADKCPGR